MSAKKSIINKDRFKSLAKVSQLEDKVEETEDIEIKSRFAVETPNVKDIKKISIAKLKPAPKEWNFYQPLPKDKFVELMESIEKNTLLHPIVVWEQEDEKYMILSGHNRANAYQKLYEITRDDQYLKIPALVKKAQEIDENIAREIIVDTNWIQRQLTSYEKTHSILQKYVKIKKTRSKGSKTRDLIAKELGISGRMVQNYLSLNTLKNEFFDRIDRGDITIKQAVLIGKLTEELQDYIIQNFDKLSLDNKKLKEALEAENIVDAIATLRKKEEEYVTIKLKIEKAKEEEFWKMYKTWLKKQ